jgi:lipopolysaccharide transport system ATP-binding protein
MKPAIRVAGLRKRYRIGERRQPYTTLRESLLEALRAPLRVTSAPAPHIWALDGVDFEAMPGEMIGVVGRNGAGKTTLLKIIARITAPTEGCVELRGRLGSLLEVGTGFHPELTGRENVFLNGAILGMSRREITRKFDEIVAFAESGEFIDTPVKHYSSGMYARLAFSVAAHLETEILLVDEVLAVGDLEFQKKCLAKMNDVVGRGRTVLFVSHNMSSVAAVCGRGLLLDRGRMVTLGPIAETLDVYLKQGGLNQVSFEGQSLKRASVRHSDAGLEIVADYCLPRPVKLPCLGFVVCDTVGNPICGTNPKVDGIRASKEPKSEGRVRVILKNPRLLEGTYRVSLWFGDGHDDFFHQRDCLVFDVVPTGNYRRAAPRVSGPVLAECEWRFE